MLFKWLQILHCKLLRKFYTSNLLSVKNVLFKFKNNIFSYENTYLTLSKNSYVFLIGISFLKCPFMLS
jgi:hypothetical protein